MLRNFSFALLIVLLMSAGASVARAALSEFELRQLIGGDVTPPTAPSALVVTPVATTQINLSWASSTDNFLLSGYLVYRDDVQIATTTGVTYADTGLTASTLYSYYVTAFDSSFNISASSTPSSTTTLDVPPPTSTSSTTFGSQASLRLQRLEIIPAQDSVLIRFETSGYAKSVIKWGTTITYELGSLAESVFTKLHETRIVGLRPGETYTFIIEAENSRGRRVVLTEGTFTTLPADDILPPGNVQNLKASKSGNDIVLTWTNPTDADFEKVRVVRSESFYPSDIADGWVVYEGDGGSIRDEGLAVEGAREYYTVFSYDTRGNISSGAVVAFMIRDGVLVPPLPVTTENPIELRFIDLVFSQDGERVPVLEDQVELDGGRNFLISLPYARVPEHLKTILVTLVDSADPKKEFTFLLRINSDKTAYSAYLAPLGVSGMFPLRVTVFDFKTAQVGYTDGELHSEIMQNGEKGVGAEYVRDYFMWFLLILLMVAIVGFRLLYGSRKQGKRS